MAVNLALIPHFLQAGWSVEYIGSETGIEKQLISALGKVNYYAIKTGKLRRYFDWQNLKDPFKVVKGAYQAYRYIRANKPDVVFSKGGFVSVPVVLGAWLNKVPVIIHESDITPGLANKLCIPFASRICTTFPETGAHLKTDKTVYVGALIRPELKDGRARKGKDFCSFKEADKPVLLVMGGSLGSKTINRNLRESLAELGQTYNIVHLCGKGQLDASINNPAYRQYEYINEQLPDVLAMTDMVISRAGANSIFEFLSLRKPMLLIPLTQNQSRGDQLLNAESFRKSGFCEVLLEEQLTALTLTAAIHQLFHGRMRYIDNMNDHQQEDAAGAVVGLIFQIAR
ncbi:UDP-N-acetylglucosamine--N-acetylmuramyl-(pentapeptide) pyrophosphoryl-undecaprenol N-acetylglucosamine transferase 3 [Paenibacillus nasutitermitis]|uniref:UDP-N-acetylglucosamine--N-acetylmuramyl-(pentapeptide) pyrophosphoryl-undecaprenol N-acetylglucosamine transferase n=1 Tax=Paenibacillus nasutitermitis TaxID=1652958 RepID=A0A916YRE9_9BACL|nr:UDP-N-acetylglucosamine--N-acetylmuramyl-(pentapeptide) pyrophosphoryl-undecaprenol N-acetylglucosamine transferase 3 [Paenibacillus nasutitermitis]